jgi:hypothetical protein
VLTFKRWMKNSVRLRRESEVRGGETSASHGHPYTIFRRALEHGNLLVAEALGETPPVSGESSRARRPTLCLDTPWLARASASATVPRRLRPRPLSLVSMSPWYQESPNGVFGTWITKKSNSVFGGSPLTRTFMISTGPTDLMDTCADAPMRQWAFSDAVERTISNEIRLP